MKTHMVNRMTCPVFMVHGATYLCKGTVTAKKYISEAIYGALYCFWFVSSYL